MRSQSKARGLLLAAAFAAGLAAAPAAAAPAAEGASLAGSPDRGPASAAYLDAGALGSGIAYSAVHLRAGAVFPLEVRDSWGLEAELYWTRPDDLAFFQADALGLYRRRLGDEAGLYLGAGSGLGFSRAAFVESLGGADAYADTRIKAVLLVEAGYELRLFSTRLYLEPFVRAYAVAGMDFRSGSALGAGTALAGWSASASGEAGLRLGRRF